MRAWLLLLSLTPLLSSCSEELPGEVVGTFNVTMDLVDSTCGEDAVYLRDGEKLAVELRADGAKGYWRFAGGQPIEGKREGDAFTFTFSTVVGSEAGDAGPDRCVLQQDEKLEAAVEEGTDKARQADKAADYDAGAAHDCDDDGESTGDGRTLSGSHVLTILPTAGSDCSVALRTMGGAYEALPCTIRYTLRGAERDAF